MFPTITCFIWVITAGNNSFQSCCYSFETLENISHPLFSIPFIFPTSSNLLKILLQMGEEFRCFQRKVVRPMDGSIVSAELVVVGLCLLLLARPNKGNTNVFAKIWTALNERGILRLLYVGGKSFLFSISLKQPRSMGLCKDTYKKGFHKVWETDVKFDKFWWKISGESSL